MKSIRKSLNAYIAYFRLGMRLAVSNRSDLISIIMIYLCLLTVFYAIYKTMPLHELGHAGLTADHLLWYFTITEIVVISCQRGARAFGNLIADGELTLLLQNPCAMMGLFFSRIGGTTCVNLVILTIVGFTFTTLMTGMTYPFPAVYLPAFFLSLVLGSALFLLLGYMVGTLEIHGPYSKSISWIVHKFIFTFGGLFFPVVFFPDVLRIALAFTPFPSIIGASGNFVLLQEENFLFAGIAWQIMWIVFLGIAAFVVERRMIRTVLTQGD